MPPLSSFVCLDFETTGWHSANEYLPWQIGVARFSGPGFATVELYESLLNVPASHVFNPYTPGRWASLRDQLESAPRLPVLWPQLRPFLEQGLLVAHNAAVERGILNAAFPVLNTEARWLDTLKIARVAYPRQPGYALEDLASNLQYAPQLEQYCPGRKPHDALYDAVSCGLLLRSILAWPPWNALDARELCEVR